MGERLALVIVIFEDNLVPRAFPFEIGKALGTRLIRGEIGVSEIAKRAPKTHTFFVKF